MSEKTLNSLEQLLITKETLLMMNTASSKRLKEHYTEVIKDIQDMINYIEFGKNDLHNLK